MRPLIHWLSGAHHGYGCELWYRILDRGRCHRCCNRLEYCRWLLVSIVLKASDHIVSLIDAPLTRQEFNAEKTMDSLKSLSSPTASVVRNSENITIPTVEIVPGDMVELKTGDTVPADLRFAALSLGSQVQANESQAYRSCQL